VRVEQATEKVQFPVLPIEHHVECYCRGMRKRIRQFEGPQKVFGPRVQGNHVASGR